jgi:hypothetical protein
VKYDANNGADADRADGQEAQPRRDVQTPRCDQHPAAALCVQEPSDGKAGGDSRCTGESGVEAHRHLVPAEVPDEEREQDVEGQAHGAAEMDATGKPEAPRE